jgi:hypothetical protein
MISLTVFVSLLFFYSLITQRLDRTIFTAGEISVWCQPPPKPPPPALGAVPL